MNSARSFYFKLVIDAYDTAISRSWTLPLWWLRLKGNLWSSGTDHFCKHGTHSQSRSRFYIMEVVFRFELKFESETKSLCRPEPCDLADLKGASGSHWSSRSLQPPITRNPDSARTLNHTDPVGKVDDDDSFLSFWENLFPLTVSNIPCQDPILRPLTFCVSF